MSKSTVYFTNELTPEAVVKMYKQLGVELPGKVAVKVHSGEDGNQNYLHPEFMKPVIDAVHGTVVECNTAYGGARNETPKHIELMKNTTGATFLRGHHGRRRPRRGVAGRERQGAEGQLPGQEH